MTLAKLPTDFYYKKCMYCSRPVIVKIGRFGVSHIGSLDIACTECIPKEHLKGSVKDLIEANKSVPKKI